MTENVSHFFERCEAEPALKARIQEAVAAYPGSLEVRVTRRGKDTTLGKVEQMAADKSRDPQGTDPEETQEKTA